ncbi:SgcJ/EcaC family oxidoreductase [Lysobacter sp. 5GHs7-4]|uniref:YybH family protein n=1 Tax=Lysobacter sp. 5GHs7-4 TaxID=2904253 RepID=UPI001E6128A5|nr:SgcJ/EcaC family oxidoreductase [Lysobacter sp. 5GHs7-4]UHQ23945.1 SgcJ/EcaC family oxidoreductase [Lysobacter sp. 5GHs7-4]
MPNRLRQCAIGLLLAGSLWSAMAQAAAATPPRSLQATLDAHLAAINARDLDALLATVTRGERLTLILPNGQVLDTREQFRALHVDWFAERDWRMRFEIRSLRELGDVGVALVKYESQALQADGSFQTRRNAWLSLVFAKEADGWRLVYDQNTVIPPATP